MADRPSPRDSPDPALVKRALRALADGTATPTSGAPAPTGPFARGVDARATVEEATTALQTVRTAAAFVGDGGLRRLRDAVAIAESRDDRSLARAGQHLLAHVEHYRAVADGGGPGPSDARAVADEGDPGQSDADATDHAAGDHFRSARGTVLSAGGQERTE